MKILDRYIVKELLGPFFTGTAVFTLLFMSMDTLLKMAHILVSGQGIWQAFLYLLESLPYILVLTFPMAVLLSCLLAFGRLSSESELTALKAGGISFVRIAMPGILLSLLISVGSYFLNEEVVPDAFYAANNINLGDFTKHTALRDNITFRDTREDGSEQQISARKLDPDQGIMYQVNIQSFEHGQRTREVYAEQVIWLSNHWIMHNVHTYDYILEPPNAQEVKMVTTSDSMVLTLFKTPKELALRERFPEEMSRKDLLAKILAIRRNPYLPKDALYNRCVLLYHEKLAIPFTCFVFGLLGMPLGVRPQRTSPSVGLGISLIFILAYYVLMTVAHALGENSFVPAGFAAWVPNIVFGIIGLWLVYRASKA